MSIPSPEALLYSLLLGALLGLLFTGLEALRILLALGKFTTGLLDVLLCLIASAASFLLALAVSAGQIRFFQAGCEALGFFAVYVTVTAAVRHVLMQLTRRITRFGEKLHKRTDAVGKKSLQKKRPKMEKAGQKSGLFQILSKKNEKKT